MSIQTVKIWRRLVSLVLLLGAGFFLLSLAGCTPKPDPKKDFQMFLDGSVFSWESAPGVGYIYGGEDEPWSLPASIRVVLPNNRPSRHPLPGMEIMFDAAVFADTSQVTVSGASDGLSVDFRPSFRPMGRNGILVGYSSHHPQAVVTLRVDKLDARHLGKVSGKIIYACLWGYYYDCETGELTKPPKPFKLEIWNWPFEVILERKYPGDE
jgi:hypothetical protein